FNLAGYCIGAAAARTPEKTALIVVSDADAPSSVAERWRYAPLDLAVRRTSAGLLSLGLVPGDRILLRMPNNSDYALLFFGATAAGLVPIPVSAQMTQPEAQFLLEDSGARAVAQTEALAIDGIDRGWC